MTTFANQVAIGPEFFKKAFNDYADWGWALVREFFQNSADAGSTEIRFTVKHEQVAPNQTTILTVTNNGSPMTRDILVNKLLALGGSGKNFQGSVGGFGKAKEILYFCHQRYVIQSGNLVVTGSGAGYDIEEVDYTDGTTSTILMDGDHVTRICSALTQFASYCQWDGDLYLNDQKIHTKLRKGSPRREIESGTVYTNRTYPGRMIVRMGGIPMFWSYVGCDRGVILELGGKSSDCLTANRDGLNGEYQRELNSFITSLSVDKKSALKPRGARYTLYAGDRIRHGVKSNATLDVTALVLDTAKLVTVTSPEDPAGTTLAANQYAYSQASVANTLQEFIVKNETDMLIPNHFSPGSRQFSPYSKKLTRIWGRLMLEMHRMFDKSGDFAIGFIFDDSVEAEYENGPYGTVYYINPVEIVSNTITYASRSMKKRFKLTEKNRLLMLALHEFIHGCGYVYHDEVYSTKLTNMAWMVMEQRKRFNWCFA